MKKKTKKYLMYGALGAGILWLWSAGKAKKNAEKATKEMAESAKASGDYVMIG